MDIDTTALGLAFIAFGLLLFVIEIFQPGFLIAVPATVLFALGFIIMAAPWMLDGWYAVPLILLIGGVTLYATLKFYQSLAPPDSPPTGGITEYIGKVCIVIEPVDQSLRGMVDLGLQKVRARSDREIPVGARVKVVDAQGIHVVVEEIKD